MHAHTKVDEAIRDRGGRSLLKSADDDAIRRQREQAVNDAAHIIGRYADR